MEPKAIEEKLKNFALQLHLVTENIKGYAIYLVDLEGIIQTWSHGARDLTGYAADEVIGKSISLFYSKKDSENNIVDNLLHVGKERDSIESETWCVRKDGSIFWATITLSTVYDTDQELIGYSKIIRDCTGQKALQEKLNSFNSELKETVFKKTIEFENIFERITDAFIAFNSDWCFTYINKKAGEILRMNIREFIGKRIECMDPAVRELPFLKKVEEAMEQQKYITCEEYFPFLQRWFIIHTYPSSKGVSIFFSDITEQKRVKQQLELSELRYQSLVEHASDIILIGNERGYFLDVNSSACRLLGYSREEMLSMNVKNFIVDDADMPRYALLKAGKSTIRELKLRRKDGSTVETESSAVMLPDGRILGILRDITERKKIERKIKESEASLKEAQRLAKIGDWCLTYSDNRLEWSDETYRIFDLPLSVEPSFELLLQHIPAEELKEFNETYWKSVEERTEFELYHRVITKKGVTKYVHGKGMTYCDEAGNAIRTIGTVQDITDQKLADESRLRSEVRFKQIFDSNMVGFLFCDDKGEIVEANNRFLEIVGYSQEDLKQGKLKWREMTPPEYASVEEKAYEEIMVKGFCQPFDKEYVRKDGTRIPITLGAAAFDSNDIVKGVAYVLDISERKRAETEIRQSQEELRQLTSHLHTIREEERALMAREIHDELGQQLTGLKMDLYWLNNHNRLSTDVRRKKMMGTLNLIDATINTVRKISTELHPSILDDLGLVEALEWYSKEFQTRSSIAVKFHSTLTEIDVEPKVSIGLFRIYQESLTNVARHAAAQQIDSSLELVNDQLQLKIADNGKGFDRQKITDKKTLGLLSMKERTLMMGGHYEITSELGKGTIVLVIVPLPARSRSNESRIKNQEIGIEN